MEEAGRSEHGPARRQRKLTREAKPYSKSVSHGADKKLAGIIETKLRCLLDEKARVSKLPVGNYSRHRLAVINKAISLIEIGDAYMKDKDKELEELLRELAI